MNTPLQSAIQKINSKIEIMNELRQGFLNEGGLFKSYTCRDAVIGMESCLEIIRDEIQEAVSIQDQIKKTSSELEESLEVDDYTLKTNEELIDVISKFGCGETEFHTADIERLIRENQIYKKYFDNHE